MRLTDIPGQGQIDIKYSIGASSAFETSKATVSELSHDHNRSALPKLSAIIPRSVVRRKCSYLETCDMNQNTKKGRLANVTLG